MFAATQTPVEAIGEEAYFADKEDNLEMDATEGGVEDDSDAPKMFTLSSEPPQVKTLFAYFSYQTNEFYILQYYSDPPF